MKFLGRQSRRQIFIYALLLVVAIGILDYFTGEELRFGIFYLLPISIMAWYLGRRAGIIMSLIGAAVQLASDVISPNGPSLPVTLWNNFMALGVFLIVVYILSGLRREYQKRTSLIVKLRKSYTDLRKTERILDSKARELSRSNEELEHFAYIAAHDLKSPLIAIEGNLLRLRRKHESELDSEARELISHQFDAISSMRELIDGLLSYARIGTNVKSRGPVNSNEILEQTKKALAPEIKKSGTFIENDPLPMVKGDPMQISQLFQNLIGNAIKFHGESAPRIEISARRKGDKLVFSVSDNGIGIPPGEKDRIFQLFKRSSLSAGYSGTGLGLAICKKIVESNEGNIWVESEPGKGSTFYFTLPASGAETSPEKEPSYSR